MEVIDQLIDSNLSLWVLKIGLSEQNIARFRREKIARFFQEYYPSIEVEHYDHLPPKVKQDNLNVSFSYSREYAAILLSDSRACGVDLQTVDVDITKGGYLFTTDKERELLSDKTAYFAAWSAKEAAYKLLQGNVNSFRDDLSIEKVGREEIVLTTPYGAFHVVVKSYKDFVLAFVIDEKNLL